MSVVQQTVSQVKSLTRSVSLKNSSSALLTPIISKFELKTSSENKFSLIPSASLASLNHPYKSSFVEYLPISCVSSLLSHEITGRTYLSCPCSNATA